MGPARGKGKDPVGDSDNKGWKEKNEESEEELATVHCLVING